MNNLDLAIALLEDSKRIVQKPKLQLISAEEPQEEQE